MAGCRRPSKTSPPWRWAVRSVGVHADGGRPGTRHRDHRCRIVALGAHVHRVGWRGRRPGTVGAVGVARAQRIRLVRALILGWRAMSMLAAPLCVLSSALAVNAWVGYFSSSATGEHSGAGASLSGGLATPAAANLCLIRSDPARRRFDYIACLCVRRRIRPVVSENARPGPSWVGADRCSAESSATLCRECSKIAPRARATRDSLGVKANTTQGVTSGPPGTSRISVSARWCCRHSPRVSMTRCATSINLVLVSWDS